MAELAQLAGIDKGAVGISKRELYGSGYFDVRDVCIYPLCRIDDKETGEYELLGIRVLTVRCIYVIVVVLIKLGIVAVQINVRLRLCDETGQGGGFRIAELGVIPVVVVREPPFSLVALDGTVDIHEGDYVELDVVPEPLAQFTVFQESGGDAFDHVSGRGFRAVVPATHDHGKLWGRFLRHDPEERNVPALGTLAQDACFIPALVRRVYE